MSLHSERAAALLAWVNSTKVCPDPLHDLSQLQDCKVFIMIIHKIHRSKEGESLLEQPLPERISFILGFLQKHCRHKSAIENLVSAQKLVDGEELTLAKVAVLLLYLTSISCKSPGDWSEFDYKTQVELASILRFVLDNEESLNENLEPFLLRKAPPSSSGTSSSCFEEHSPPHSFPHKQEVRFLELQRIASFPSTNSMLPSPPSSPMGDIMQTPQFQLRRLKKQLAFERENRDELEVELAENHKLIMEKEAQITMMQQRIDRLTKLTEKQAADQLEPEEMEELREKNESLVRRLHETFRQCHELKTERAQMDRKINQLSEENGDLSFKLRAVSSHLFQLQEAQNKLSEDYDTALAESQKKQGQLTNELHAALQDKKSSEEKIEILQGKISLLEDQLAKLEECSSQERGEVMGDILKLEELKQEVSRFTTKVAELEATVLRLEEEKQLQEAALQSERGRFEEEKQKLRSLVTSLQSSLPESHRAQERLEQDLQPQDAEGQAGQLAALRVQHEQTLQERDSALQQLQQLQEANASQSSQLQAIGASQATLAEEKAALSHKVSKLEAQILELSAQQQQGAAAEALKAQVRELEARLKESQQRLAEREKLARENSRLQEQLLFLEESLRNTEGILEDEKRRAADSLEGNLARIAELEAERQQLVQSQEQVPQERGEELTAHQVLEESREKPMGASPASRGEDRERMRLEEEIRALSQEHGQVCQQLQAEQEKVAALKAQAEHLAAEQQERLTALQADLSSAQAWVKEKESEEQKLRAEVSSLQEKMAVAEQTAAQRMAGLEADARRATEALEGVSQQLSQEKLKAKELEGTMERLRSTEKELVSLRSAMQEKESWKEQVSQCVQEMERKNSLIASLEHEVSILHRQVTEKEGESKELKRLILAESEKSKKLEERLRVLQTEMATAASRAAERCSLMKVEVQRCQEEMEKQRMTIEALKRDRHCQSEREDELRQEAKVCQDKCQQKEQLLAALQQELDSAQALAGELPALKHLCQQLQAERASLESQHRQELEQRMKATDALQAELAQAKQEAAEVLSLRERSSEQDRAIQQLRGEAAKATAQLAGLQQANARLAEENQGLSESQSQGQQQLEVELDQAREQHMQELEQLRAASEELVTISRKEAEEAAQKLEKMSKEYESSKAAALEERKKMLEERQRLTAQVEQLEVFQKDQAKQVEELNKKLTQHEKATLIQQQRAKALEEELQEKVAELQGQLAQKERAAEHYKGQMEKAKIHYDAKKQQNQDLAEKLKAMEQLQKENTELRSKSDRLAKELQQSILQAKESELSCRNLTSQVRSLEAQVEFAEQQLQELSKFQMKTTSLKGLETCHQNLADQSTDSLDEAQPLNSTRQASSSEASAVPLDREELLVSQRLPQEMESLESLYFTPIASETRSQLESSTDSLGNVSLESGCKTHSAQLRTTINITVTNKQAKSKELDCVNVSFYSIPPAQSPSASPAKRQLRSTASTYSLTSFPSQETLGKPETSCPETSGNSVLLGLPGYHHVTRRSMRSQGTKSSSLGQNTFYLGTCQEEPEQPGDWNRVAELQRRNQACPPHLKTSYPLESGPSTSSGTITEEEMKMGDPEETLQRTSMQASEIMPPSSGEGTSCSTLGQASAGITTRQQRKRLYDETHQSPDTPQSKKRTTCFPQPQTTQDSSEQHSSQVGQQREEPASTKRGKRRQSMAFAILNTPRTLGNRLLRRVAARKSTPKNTASGSTRRSSRIATAKSSKGKDSRQSLEDKKS
ncbi:nuclear mitotic apparatus protein 1 [Myiozetetes cayanensis]|uniref:nuclear mitotic apparatus protein 1 n=1 Tax=Myiozetetes cayanensis TaxID=478635 RepID=UPI00215F91A4|nr:nuclear mitotic apparatus protein 1 [Myiozetetes cayanensis]XP_050187279.1 nuclear mitotic apparatus protein 1 [Myiozetetes cayanensis]XP_050187280.1 nuclear mitotic apparatus protein 1 [Myiozetetes cayanensis]